MKRLSRVAFVGFAVAILSCNTAPKNTETAHETAVTEFTKGSFGYDRDFLRARDTNLILLKSDDSSAQIIISPKYQGKVFTSTAEGASGKSFGWVNHKAFDGPLDPHMNAYGGEDRLWLGPEGGKFSLYFKPGVKMDFDNWFTPPGIDHESWQLVKTDGRMVAMAKDMSLRNYAGSELQMKVERVVEMLDKPGLYQQLGITVPGNIKSVAFKTTNSVTNTGKVAWTETSGAPCLWSLNMFMPSETCTIVIPYIDKASGKVATTDYFGEIPADRVKYSNGLLYFKADGKSRGKLGIPPPRAKDIAGSYDAASNTLTITRFDIDAKGKYLNQEWRTDRDPYSGDAMNAYNDGPLTNGTQMGPFYEIESVSPAAFLKPGEKLTHQHSVFHFTGDKASLNEIAQILLGVTLEMIEAAFKTQ